ncbi:hypothetical protein RSK20926_06342 [Roseobacter sp. SK209-2-6]|nr:hypothetical protein RSK20926_06342 [Roseobacter sp. SK209-2-6]
MQAFANLIQTTKGSDTSGEECALPKAKA